MMWIRKIAKRKTQFAIIMLLTMMATAILTACISFTVETQRFVKEYYSADKHPIGVGISLREDAAKLLREDEEVSKVISEVKEGNAKLVKDNFYVNDKLIANEGNFVYGVNKRAEIGYSVEIAQGEEAEAPGNGEIWISNIFSDNYDVQVGDTFRIGKEKEYDVSAIVNTAICSSGFIDSHPFYVNEQELVDIEGTDVTVVLMMTDDETVTLRDVREALPEEYVQSQLSLLDRETLKMCITILSGIFGGVGMAASLIILCVSIVVFRYLIRATIAKEYEMIGIYKALGRDDKEIKKIYLTAYMVSGIAGMIPGVFLARPLARYLSGIVLGGNKLFTLSSDTIWIEVASLVFMSVLLILNVSSELKKVRNISPIQAMNIQSLSSSEKVVKSIIPNASSSVAMAVNGIWKRRGMSLLIILILSVSVYMNVMAGETALTLSNYAQDNEIWQNLPSYSCVVKTMGNEKALEYIRNSEDVDDYVQVILEPQCIDMVIEGTEWTAEQAHPMIYDSFSEERYKDVPFSEGRICLEKHEIAAAKNFLNEVDKKVGDYIKFSNGEKEINCLIVGKYSAMMKGGASFYMCDEDFRELGFTPDFQTILVFLKENVDYDTFAKEFEASVEDSHIYKDFGFIEQEGDTVFDIAYPICVVLFGAFFAFSVLNILNLVHTQLKENRRKYGILKAMGFTTGYICREMIANISILYVAALIITIILNELLSPILFSLASGVCYICKPIWIIAAVGGGMYVILMLMTLFMLRSIKNIKPVELMEE